MKILKDARYIKYDNEIRTEGGMSGGPIFREDKDSNGEIMYYVIGIHKGYMGETDGGILIVKDYFDKID